MSAAPGPLPHSRPSITAAERAAVDAQLAGGMLAEGMTSAAAAEAVAARFGCAGGRSVASGTAAITVALAACAVGPGDDVLMPSYACPDVAAAIRATGARPAVADLDAGAWTSGADAFQRVRTERTKAIVVVHTFGHPVEVGGADGVASLGLPVIEDACHVPRPMDPASAYATFSFHATKALAAGEGGFVGATDPHRVAALRTGRADDLAAIAPMSDLAACLLAVQLDRWAAMAERRRAIAARYLDALPGDWTAAVRPIHARTPDLVPFRLPLTVASDSDALIADAAAAGIHVRRGVDSVRHRDGGDLVAAPLPAYPESDTRLATTVSPPLHPSLSDADVDRIVDRLTASAAARRVRA